MCSGLLSNQYPLLLLSVNLSLKTTSLSRPSLCFKLTMAHSLVFLNTHHIYFLGSQSTFHHHFKSVNALITSTGTFHPGRSLIKYPNCKTHSSASSSLQNLTLLTTTSKFSLPSTTLHSSNSPLLLLRIKKKINFQTNQEEKNFLADGCF